METQEATFDTWFFWLTKGGPMPPLVTPEPRTFRFPVEMPIETKSLELEELYDDNSN